MSDSGMRRLVKGMFVLPFVGVCWLSPASHGQDEKALRGDLDKLAENAAKTLGEEIAKILGNKELQKQFVDEVMKAIGQHLGKRIRELEQALAGKDKEITDLRKKIEELTAEVAKLKAQPQPKPKPKPKPEPKKPSEPFLGVSHVDHERGAHVTTVHGGSPAASAGIRVGDILVALNGKAVTSESLSSALKAYKPGTEVKLAVLRGDKKLEIVAKLVDREKFLSARKAPEPQPLLLGIEVDDDDEQGGVIVYSVDEGYTGHVIQLAKGDRILKFNGVGVKTTAEIKALVLKVKAGERFSIVTQRGKDTFEIVAVGSSGKGGAKLISRTAVGGEKVAAKPEPKPKPKPEPKPTPVRKPGHLGISVLDLTIEKVTPGSAAAASGLAVGDVITKVNGQDIVDVDQLKAITSKLFAGDKVTIVVKRGEETKEIKDIVLGVKGEAVKPSATPSASAGGKKDAKKQPVPKTDSKKTKPGYIGISIYEDEIEQVLVIKEIFPGGPGEKAALKPGDLLIKIGGKEVRNFDQLETVIDTLSAGQEIVLSIKRNDKSLEIKLTLGEEVVQG